MENRNELDLGLMTTEDMKSVEKIWRLMLLKNGRKKAALELMHCG